MGTGEEERRKDSTMKVIAIKMILDSTAIFAGITVSIANPELRIICLGCGSVALFLNARKIGGSS